MIKRVTSRRMSTPRRVQWCYRGRVFPPTRFVPRQRRIWGAFVDGFVSPFTIGNVLLDNPKVSLPELVDPGDGEHPDIASIRNSWEAVGRYLQNAFDQLEQEQRPHNESRKG